MSEYETLTRWAASGEHSASQEAVFQAVANEIYDLRAQLTAATARAEAAEARVMELEGDQRLPEADDLTAIGVVGRIPTVTKHRAANLAHIKEMIDGLDVAGLRKEADTLAWSVWWRVLDRQREVFLLADKDKRIAELEALLRGGEAAYGEYSAAVAAELSTLRQQAEGMAGALEPFEDYADETDGLPLGDKVAVYISHVREARRLLSAFRASSTGEG